MSAANILGTGVAALLNSFWQSALIALLAWTALQFLPRLGVRINAATRCAVWWTVLMAVVLLPFAPDTGQRGSSPAPAKAVAAILETRATAVPASAAPAMPIETAVAPARAAGPLEISTGAALIAILGIWLALSLFRAAQIVRSYRYLRGIKDRSRPVSSEQLINFNYWLLACGIDRTARLLVSSEIASPMAVGFRRPAVIVPESLLNEFTEEELDQVILHELAHVARYDDWTNLFGRLLGALLPIHPVAVWVLKRIEQDREVACDDWVVAMTGDARPYAASLTRLFELCAVRRRQLLATGMAGRASHLGERIEALLRSGRDFTPHVSLVRVALGAGILFALVLLAAQTPHWIAFAQEPPEAPVAPVPPVAPEPPQVPIVSVAPEPPQTPVAPIAPAAPQPPQAPAEFNEDVRSLQDELRSRSEQLRELQRQLAQENRVYTQDHPAIRDLTNEIRAHEAELQARKAEMEALQVRAQAQQQAQVQGQQAQIQAQQALVQSQAQQVQQEQLLRDQQNRRAGGSFLAALVAAGYGNLSVDEIIELRNSGVSPDFLRAVADSGLGKPSAKELTEMARSGVSPQYLRALRDNGFKNMSAQDVIEAARSGVRPELIRALRDAFPQITMRQIVDAAHSGLNANDLRQAREYGPNLTLEQIIKLKHAGVI
jgi:beta-lactamase regulating signal transducer with metallopeptidase domain